MPSASVFRRVSGLTVAALWSSGTTYLLFALYARSASAADLGRFVALSSVVMMAAQLLDGGTGLLMVRDVAATGSDGERQALMALTLRRRVRGLFLAVPLVGAASLWLFAAGDYLAAAIAAVFLAGTAIYGFVLQVFQATRNFRRLVFLQMANGAVFVGGAALVMVVIEQPSVSVMLLVPAGAFVLLALAGLGAVWRQVSGTPAVGGAGHRELYAVRGGATAVAVTSNADQVLLGAVSATTLAAYAGAQRAALGVAALSTALMAYLLPTVSAGEPEQHRRLLRLTSRSTVPVGLASAAIGAALAWPLRVVYDDPNLAEPAVLALLMPAYALGALSTPSVSVLYAHRRGAMVAALTTGQAVIVLAGCAAAAAAESAVGTAAVVLVGRVAYLIGTAHVASRTLRSMAAARA